MAEAASVRKDLLVLLGLKESLAYKDQQALLALRAHPEQELLLESLEFLRGVVFL